MVRNPSGMTPVLSYLNSRSIKSWTATTMDDAAAKISDNQIQIVFLSLSLKNVSIAAIIEQIKNQFAIPIVIFSEETSRKIEGDMSRLATANKIVPPNQNAKFLQMIQKNVGSEDNSEDGGDTAVVEDLLPPQSEPIEGSAVPEQGRWLKINMDENAKAPFTYKLIQPRSLVIHRTRYFFVGAKIPELSPEGRGWVASDGQFYVSGRIVEMAAEPMNAPSEAKVYQFSQEENTKSVPTPIFISEEPKKQDVGQLSRTPEPRVHRDSIMRRLWKRFRPSQSPRSEHFFNRLRGKFMSMRGKANFGSFSYRKSAMLNTLRNMAAFRERIKSLQQAVSTIPDASDVIEMFQQIRPWVSREPANEIERALVKAAVRTMDPPFKDEAPPAAPSADRVSVAFIRSAELEGFILSDATDAGSDPFGLLGNLINTSRDRLNRKLNGVELTLPPTVVNVDPMNLRDLAAQGGHFSMWADNGTQRLFVVFVPAPGVELPRASTDHDKLEVQAESLDAELKLLFDLYLHMPLNDKRLQFRRTGQMVSSGMVEKLKDSPDTEILIDPASEPAFFAYSALAALKKPRG